MSLGEYHQIGRIELDAESSSIPCRGVSLEFLVNNPQF
jgi:hypothetical protein